MIEVSEGFEGYEVLFQYSGAIPIQATAEIGGGAGHIGGFVIIRQYSERIQIQLGHIQDLVAAGT